MVENYDKARAKVLADKPELFGKTFAGILGGSGVTLKIPDVTGITEAGVYMVKILFTDSEGNIRGLTPTPEYLTFYA